jgi:hypothetical protein
MEQLIQSVRDGTFDFTLTKPEDAQLITSIGRIGIWEIINIFLGFSLLVIALIRLGGTIGGLQAIEFLLMLLTGSVIIYSFFLILATLAFWLDLCGTGCFRHDYSCGGFNQSSQLGDAAGRFSRRNSSVCSITCFLETGTKTLFRHVCLRKDLSILR